MGKKPQTKGISGTLSTIKNNEGEMEHHLKGVTKISFTSNPTNWHHVLPHVIH